MAAVSVEHALQLPVIERSRMLLNRQATRSERDVPFFGSSTLGWLNQLCRFYGGEEKHILSSNIRLINCAPLQPPGGPSVRVYTLGGIFSYNFVEFSSARPTISRT
jgi:hypothetical protein